MAIQDFPLCPALSESRRIFLAFLRKGLPREPGYGDSVEGLGGQYWPP